MADQKDRTSSGPRIGNVSWTVESLDSKLRSAFKKWLPRFKKRIHNTIDAPEAWDRLLKACDAQDLEWAFFWAVDQRDADVYGPKILKDFFEQSADLLGRMNELWPPLKKLMDLRLFETPVWWAYTEFFGFTEKEVWRFFRFPADLVWFKTKLQLFGAGKKFSWSRRRAPLAFPAEIVSFYVNVCTGKPHHRETSLLVRVAAEAYGFAMPDEDEDDPFSQEAIEQDYKRRRREHGNDVGERESDIRELLARRETTSDRLDLIPFLVARKKAREKPSIDYIKGLYSKPRIPS